MSIFQKLFGPKVPTLKKDDIPNFEKVSEFIVWFIKNDPIVTAIYASPTSNRVFNEGYRPKKGIRTQNNPELVEPVEDINRLAVWFMIKVFIDLNILKNVSKNEFMQFIDILDKFSRETLITGGEIARKYDLNLKNFVYEKDYEREIKKIPAGTERDQFKINLLDIDVLDAETRILGWLYHEYFGEWYQPREKRNE